MSLDRMKAALETRFGEPFEMDAQSPGREVSGLETLARMAERGSHRAFKPDRVDPELLRTLSAIALSSPTKSDLQQRDVVIVRDPEIRAGINACVAEQSWIADAPELLVFCGNNRRQRQVHQWRGRDFANDHLDAFFNAAVDAGIAMAAFVTAAEAIGLGTCPVSAVRNEAAKISDLLGLPDHVFPVAGLAVGWPAREGYKLSLRLPTAATVHTDRFSEDGIEQTVAGYDARRLAAQPYRSQRFTDRYGESDAYTWSEDKARQYSAPERADFGEFVRKKGFDLS